MVWACACSGAGGASRAGASPPPTAQAPASSPAVELVAAIDLPRTAATSTLSATCFDAPTRTLFAIKDREAAIVPLVFREDFRAITVGEPLALTGRPESPWDAEGLVCDAGAFLAVTDEASPAVERFDAEGRYLGRAALPEHFARLEQSEGNGGLESLSLSPSGRYLFTANEAALDPDGPLATKSAGTRIRILRRDRVTGADEERAYLTEPLGGGEGGDMGVSEVLAVGDDELLVLERGFQRGFGNTVRLFRVDFATGEDVLGTAALSASSPRVKKSLLVDLATLPGVGLPNDQPQPNPILANYEALALGPALPDGRRLLFVTADDNERPTQVARILVLAVALR